MADAPWSARARELEPTEGADYIAWSEWFHVEASKHEHLANFDAGLLERIALYAIMRDLVAATTGGER